MNVFDYSEIGQRIKMLRKKRGLNQSELAEKLNKSLRTVQKYETGEIEVSIAVVNSLADILETTPTYILGYEPSSAPIQRISDIIDLLFKMETVAGLDFNIEVKKPPRSKQWECSITFDGKSSADFNADICLFLEQWEEERNELRTYASSLQAYKKWQEQTLAYYAATSVECVEQQELDDETRKQKRIEYLKNECK